jgi:hypothetical protein
MRQRLNMMKTNNFGISKDIESILGEKLNPSVQTENYIPVLQQPNNTNNNIQGIIHVDNLKIRHERLTIFTDNLNKLDKQMNLKDLNDIKSNILKNISSIDKELVDINTQRTNYVNLLNKCDELLDKINSVKYLEFTCEEDIEIDTVYNSIKTQIDNTYKFLIDLVKIPKKIPLDKETYQVQIDCVNSHNQRRKLNIKFNIYGDICQGQIVSTQKY